MDSSYENLVHLFSLIRIHSNEKAQEATIYLQEMYKNPDSMFVLLQIAETNDDSVIRHSAIIAVKNNIFKHLPEYSIEQIEYVKASIINLIKKESDEIIKRYVCIIARKVLRALQNNGGFPEIIDLALSLIHDELTIGIGMFLCSNVCKPLSSDQILEFLPSLIECVSTALSGNNSNLRILSLNLIVGIVTRSVDYQYFVSNEPFQAAIQKEAQRIMNETINEDEIVVFFNTISFVQTCYFEILEPSFRLLYHLSLNALLDETKNRRLRLNTIEFIISSVDMKPSLLGDVLSDVLNVCFALSVEECNEDRDSFIPINVDNLLQLLAKDEDTVSDLISILFSYSDDALNSSSLPAFQVVLLFFLYIMDESGCVIEERGSELCALIELALKTEDELIIIAACQLIMAISEVVPNMFYGYNDTLIELLLSNAEINESLQSLESLLLSMNEVPSDLMGLLQTLLSFFGHVPTDLIIKCITGSISHAKDISEDLYTSIRDILAQLINNEEAKETSYQCFSMCTHQAPKYAVSDLSMFIESMLNSASVDSPGSLEQIVVSLGSISRTMPISIKSFAPCISGKLIPIMEEMQNLLSDSEEGLASIENAKGEVIKCLCSLYSASPEYMSQYYKQISDSLFEWISSKKDHISCYGADAVFEIGEGLMQSNADVDKLVNVIMQEIEQSSSDEKTTALFRALSQLFSQIGNKLSQDVIYKVGHFFVSCFNHEIAALIDENDDIDSSTEGSLFFGFSIFTLTGLIVKSGLFDELCSSIFQHVQTDRKMKKCYALLALSRMCYIVKDSSPDLPDFVLNQIHQLLRKKTGINNSHKINIIESICYLCLSESSSISADMQKFLNTFIMKEMSIQADRSYLNTAALAQLCLASKVGSIDVSKALESMPPDLDCEDIPLFAISLHSLIEKSSVTHPFSIKHYAITIMSSSAWIIDGIPSNTIDFFMNYLDPVSSDEIDQSLGNQEKYIELFHNNTNKA